MTNLSLGTNHLTHVQTHRIDELDALQVHVVFRELFQYLGIVDGFGPEMTMVCVVIAHHQTSVAGGATMRTHSLIVRCPIGKARNDSRPDPTPRETQQARANMSIEGIA